MIAFVQFHPIINQTRTPRKICTVLTCLQQNVDFEEKYWTITTDFLRQH